MSSTQRLSPLLMRVQRAIRAEGSFSIFRERCSVEQVVFAYAAAIGRDVNELLAEWSGKPEFVPHKLTLSHLIAKPETGDDDNDDTEQETKLCPVCRGTGRAKDGGQCSECGGSGRVPVDDAGDEDEDEVARTYEFPNIEDE